MKRRLTDTQLTALFIGKWRETDGDITAVARAIEEAGYTAGDGTPWIHRSRVAPPTANHIEAIDRRAAPIIAAVALARGLGRADIVGPSRKRKPSAARHEVVWLLRQADPVMVFEDIAIATGRTDHGAALKSIRVVEARIAERPGLREELLGLLPVRAKQARAA